MSETENENMIVIDHPTGTIHHPIERKCRPISLKHDTLIVGIPKEICNLLEIEKGQTFKVYCDIIENKIIMEMT